MLVTAESGVGTEDGEICVCVRVGYKVGTATAVDNDTLDGPIVSGAEGMKLG